METEINRQKIQANIELNIRKKLDRQKKLDKEKLDRVGVINEENNTCCVLIYQEGKQRHATSVNPIQTDPQIVDYFKGIFPRCQIVIRRDFVYDPKNTD